MSSGVLVVLILFVLMPLAIRGNGKRRDEFKERCAVAVREQGGTVLSMEEKFWGGRGPFFTRAKSQFIFKVVYEDASGARRQLWARSRTLFKDDEFIWDYDDGK